MSLTNLSRVGGLALLLGGLLEVVGLLLHPSGTDPGHYLDLLWLPANLLLLVGALLSALGWPLMYARQADRIGWLGLVGFVLTFLVGLIFNLVLGGIEAFVLPTLAANAAAQPLLSNPPPAAERGFLLLALLFELVGCLTYGIATLRAGVYPRLVGGLLLATPVLGLVSSFASLPGPLAQLDAVAFGLAMIAAGVTLLTRPTATQPSVVSAFGHS
jgi:hypothetical protein